MGVFYMQTFTLQCTDANVKNRYQKMCETIAEIRAGIEPEMTDLDKILYLHDCVVERTTYGGSGDQSRTHGDPEADLLRVHTHGPGFVVPHGDHV